jgi:hypothetical protein
LNILLKWPSRKCASCKPSLARNVLRLGSPTYRRLRQMTQRAQKEWVDDNSPSPLRKQLYEEEARDVPDITSWEERELCCIAECEEREGEGGEQEGALRYRHGGDAVTLQLPE